MRTNIFNFFIFAFSIPLFSFYSKTYGDPLIDSNNEISKYADKETPRIENGILYLTVDDIKSVRLYRAADYSCPSSEIEFTNFKPSDLYYYQIDNGIVAGMKLFHNDQLLFNPGIKIIYPSSSFRGNDLVLEYHPGFYNGIHYFDDFFYLWEYYQVFNNFWWMDEESKEKARKEVEENSKLRGEQFEVFLQYLRESGKLIDNTTNIEPVTPQEKSDISIFPNPTTGVLRIKNYELGIRNLEVYDIIGKKSLNINYQLLTVNSIDISHLPAGIYFVKITTEKGVVTKKVVKR